MTTVATRPSFSPPPIALGAESTLAALILEADEMANEASTERHEATRHRFASAEKALDHAADGARRSMWASVLSSAGKVAEGLVSAARPTAARSDGDAPEEAHGDSGSPSTGARVGGSLVDDALAACGAFVNASAEHADRDRRGAELESDRAKEQAASAADVAARERSVRESLERQLESLMHERQSIDDRAVGAAR